MARTRKPKRPTPRGFRQMNVEIREDVILKAKMTALYRRVSLAQFVERALVRAMLNPDEQKTQETP